MRVPFAVVSRDAYASLTFPVLLLLFVLFCLGCLVCFFVVGCFFGVCVFGGGGGGMCMRARACVCGCFRNTEEHLKMKAILALRK